MTGKMMGLLSLMTMTESRSGLFEIWYSWTRFHEGGGYGYEYRLAAICNTSEEVASRLEALDFGDFDVSVRAPKAYVARRAKLASMKRDRLASVERDRNNFDNAPF